MRESNREARIEAVRAARRAMWSHDESAVTELFAPSCSITMTKRRRFFWAAWWTAPPTRVPFRKPDASDGGASSYEAALAAAEKRAGTALTIVDPLWARAWIRVLRGEHPWPSASTEVPRSRSLDRPEVPSDSVWAVLGVTRDVTEDDLKLAYRKRALETHPDHGGDPVAFRRVLDAYKDARRRLRRPRRRPAP